MLHVSIRFYLEQVNPISTVTIQRKLNTTETLNRFEVEGARKAGYSDVEIAKHLAKENKSNTEETMRVLLVLEGAILSVAALIGTGLAVLHPGQKKSE